MKYIIPIAAVAGFILLLLLINLAFEKNKVKKFREKLAKNFGTFKRIDADSDKIRKVKGYFFKHLEEEEYIVDNITWADLEGDTLFNSINRCYSSCGEEYLYYMLRKPEFRPDEEALSRYNKQIDSLITDEKKRLDLQILFATLGKTGKYSVYEYIHLLSQVKPVKVILFIAVWIVYLLIAASFIYNTALGVVLLICWLIVCVAISLTKKKTVEQYISSFEYIVRTLVTADKLIKYNPEGYEKEIEEIKKLRSEIKGINAGYLSFLKQSNRSGASDMASGMMSFINSFLLFDLFVFYRMLNLVIDKEDVYDKIFALLGRMEAQISVANFKASFEEASVPEFTDEKIVVLKDAVHPLIKDCVSNSVSIDRCMLITGSNASGKSTFLRTVLINCLLAETLNVVTAKEFKMKASLLFSSMSLKDSLSDNESYYMAEINSIKRILNARNSNVNVICFLDEVLRGTNTVDRVAAASEILRNLTGEGIITFAATHDIELTYLLEKEYDNYYFREEITEEEGKEDINFSYKLNLGRSDTRNALFLLKLMGYPSEVVENAQALAQRFLTEGKWMQE